MGSLGFLGYGNAQENLLIVNTGIEEKHRPDLSFSSAILQISINATEHRFFHYWW